MSYECHLRAAAAREKAAKEAAKEAERAAREAQASAAAPEPQAPSVSSDDVSVSQQQPSSRSQLNMMESASRGWSGIMKQFGLDGLSGMTGNLGYTLAMLPDMLFGMLTGKNTSMRLDKAAFPLLMIFGGIFMNNPLLKFLMMGLGGLNILNQSHKEAELQDSQERRMTPTYKHYPDEPLDARITFNGIKGNSLMVDIDGSPFVVQVDDATIDSYQRGAVSKGALCNAVLRSYDATAHVHQNERYEQALAQQENERVVQEVVLK